MIAELQSNPEWVERRRKEAERRAEQLTAWQLAERPMVAALAAVGVRVSSVWDFVSKPTDPRAIPVLLAHLERDYPDRVREGIARSLATRESRQGWQCLLRAFKTSEDPIPGMSAKYAIGLALAAAADDSVMDDVIRLVQDVKHGQNRGPLVEVIARSEDPRAQGILMRLADDPELAKTARLAMKKRAGRTARRSSKSGRK